MLKQIVGKQIKEVNVDRFREVYGEFPKCVVDLGTGDGKFAYTFAQAHPNTLVIGIDADKSQAEDISYKASRKPTKGGLENVIFIWAKAEELPVELVNIADDIYINFPWGSLLSGVMLADPAIMDQIKAIAAPDAVLHIYVSYDAKFEEEKIASLSLPELNLEYLQTTLTAKYSELGIKIQSVKILPPEEKTELLSSWPKRILSKRDRDVYYIQATIQKDHNDYVDHIVNDGIREYSFHVYGHPNIRATHPKTLEFTKDDDLTDRGDCIIGIKADFDLQMLKQFNGKVRVICEAGGIISEFKCKVSPTFSSGHELVLRKSGFPSERTFGVGLNKGSNHLDRRIVELLQNPQTQMQVTIKAGWAQ